MYTEHLYDLFLAHGTVTTDSRNCPQGSMFFALKGDNFDGNAFAAAALERGCSLAVVDEARYAVDDRYVLVPDALEALQQMAAHHRRMLGNKFVIQVTGTNGKTTTKELLAAVLSQIAPVQYTQGNLNNHIGVPLTLLTLEDDGGFGIVETGANHPGEIAFLTQLTDPDMGLITNVGRAHLEGFGGFEGVKRTKGELYDYIRKEGKIGIFLNQSAECLPEMAHDLPAVRYGLTDAQGDAPLDVWGEVVECNPFLKIRYRQPHVDWQVVQTNLIGAYNINNVLAAIAAGVQFGVPFPLINKALKEYRPNMSRSEFRNTGRNRLIIDAYNANPSSMAVALENFAAMKGDNKMVILGDMRELGADSEAEHRKIVDLLATHPGGIGEVWLVGAEFAKVAADGMRLFPDVEAVKAETETLNGRTILIKGSNGTRLHSLPQLL